MLDPNGPFGELISGLPSGLQDVLNEVGGVANEVISGLASSSGATGTKKPFSFPILESPSEVFGMLMGEPADLVVYDMPALDFKAEFSAFFSIFGPLGVSINLEAALTIDFAFGYDTQGFIDFAASGYKNPLLLANGLYIDDDPTPGVNDGDDPAELIFTGGLWAAAELNLGIARGGVGGGIFIGVDFNLFDNDDDGKIRLDELVGNFLNQLKAPTDAEKLLAPLAVFDVSGKVTAELFAFLKIDFGLFELDKKFNITPPVTLVDFDVDFFRPPVLASEQANGDLLLHIGDFAEQRLLGDTSDFGEHLFIEDAGDGFVNIWSDNIADAGVASKQKYKVSGRIIGAGGDGNDIIDMTGVTQAGVRYDLDGGVGEDQLTGGGAGGVMRGGLGDDTLQGGGGLDLIFGNEGNDTIGGGDGADILFGDHGEIDAAFDLASRQGFVRGVVTNTDGTDIIDGEGGDDLAFGGGGGQDELSGSGGADILIGDGGLVTYASPGVVTETDDGDGAGDKLLGGAGNDLLYGGPGNDELDGQADNDILFGGLGSDTLRGGTENDILFGDFGRMNGSTAVVIAGGEADTLFGDDGADKLYGGGGNDAMSGGAGDDWAWGGTGMDLMHGDAGDDRLFGESDNDLLHGDANNDYLEGGGGNDKAWGGSGDDTLVAGYGSDVLDGEAGNDLYRITARGGTTTELTTLYDSVNDGSIDQLTFVGTPFDDTVLLRAMADSYFPSLADKLNPLIDRYFNAVQPDRLAAMLQAFEDAYGPLDLPPGMREALTAEFQDGLLNGLVQAVRDNQDAGTLRDTLEQIVEDVLASDADSKLQAMELAIQAAYDAASLTVPADLFNDLTAAYQPTGNPKLNALKAAIAPYYVRESMFPRVAGLQWLVGEVFDGTAPNKLQAMKDAITAAYGAYGVPAGMFAALDAADIADLNALQDAIADHYAADPVPESAFTNTAFIAMINNGGTDVERFNYRNLEILSVNTIDGNDYVVLDDLLATASINLGLGNDRAQIGQVFRSERTKDFEGQPAVTGIRSGDEFTTVEITRGWLSNGVSVPTTISGNDGDDEFVVFRNVAVLNLNGNDGDDLFVVRAFALAGSTDSERARTDMKGDGGADTILYVLNAPVGIDGGDGFDTVRIIGTEFSDDFVVTDAGVFGAGLNVSYVNIEKLVVDGAEGDDRYFVLSTGLGVVTEIDGGLGSDTFFVGGNPSGAPIPVISNDLRGHSGIILHSIESGDLNWAGLTVPGLSVNVGDDDEPMILVEESGGSSVVWEGGDGSTLSGWDYDTYTIRLSRAPVGSIRIAVAPAPESEEDLARDAKNLEIWDPVALTWKSAVTLTITSSNWQGQEVRFRAAKDTGIEGRRYAFINHKVDVSYFGADKSYAEAQVLSPKVQIEDDDRDAVVVLPTGGNTTVLEGGFSDEVKVVLAKAPDGPVKVVMSVMNGDVTLSRSTLWFDNDDDADAADGELWSKFQTVTVDAASDADREGFHIDFVSFNVTSADDQSGTLTLTDLGNVVVAGVLTPVVGGFLQVDGDFDLPGVQDIPDSKPTTYVLLPHRPIASSVIVKVNGVTLDGSDDDRRYDVSGNTLRFRTASGAPELRTGKVEVSYSIADVGYDGLATPDIVVDLYDNDAPAVIVEHVGGTSTDVVEGSATGDKYRIRLTQAPTQVVTVKITPTETRTSWGANAYFEQQVLASLASVKFGAVADLANGVHLWSDWVEVTVTAIQDTRIDGNDTQVFAPDLQTVNKIRGPLIIEGAAGQGSLTLPAPLMMPWELNLRPSDGTVLAFDVATSPEGLETMQVSKAELDAVVERFKEDDPSFTLAKLVGKTLEMSFGPGTAVTLDTSRPRDLFDRFWLITSVQQSGDRYTLSLKNPTAVNPLSPTVIAPEAGLSRYAITSLSVNFFADERTQVDMMFMFDDDSVANDVGRLTSSDGVVLGMTGNQMLVETSALQAAADLLKTTITGLITKTLEISVGPGLGRSFQITGIDPVAGDGGVRLLTLQALPNDAGDDVSSPTNRSEFRIAGAERHGRITGFGMGPNVLVGTRPQGGGITYGDLEVVDVRLGTGNDTVTVDYATNSEDHTTPRSGDFHTITLLDTGDGDDTVHVRLIDGDTRLDGQGNVVYDGGLGSGAFSLNLGAGADKVTDLGSTRGIVVFGGAGKDDIATGSGNDIVFGDIGRVDYVRTIPVTVNGGTVDEVLTRLGHSVVQNPVNPKVTGATSNSLSDSTKTFDDPASLIGLSVQVISSDGHVQFRTIIGASGSQIFVDRAWDSTPVFDGSKFNSFYRISAYPEDQTDGQFRGPRLVASMLPDVGDDDTVDAGGGDDIVIGGKGADTLRGGAGNDHVAGDHVQLRYVPDAASPQHVPNDGPTRFSVLTSTHRASGGADVIHGDAGQDLLLGGAFGDFIDGGLDADLVIGDNATLTWMPGTKSAIAPRYVQLNAAAIYTNDGSANVGDAGAAPSVAWGDWKLDLDMSATQADTLLGDYLAGGGGDDQIFGQRGDDVIQGDGSIASAVDGNAATLPVGKARTANLEQLVQASFEGETDGDDYVEGGIGDDVIFGNLGQDDLVGGSSTLYVPLRADRVDGSDTVYGGAGTDIARNNAGDGLHGRDADMILGDNGDILRLVNAQGAALGFTYDDAYGGVQIVVRAARLQDYTPGNQGGVSDEGTGDELHGESGDDFVYGMTGSDAIYGEAGDDDLIGGWGNDWISGGTGQDGILGDDGRLTTSRNGLTEPLSGVTVAAQQATVATGGNVQFATIHVTAELVKVANLTPFSHDTAWTPAGDEFGGLTTGRDDDILFGGLGGDWLHGGSGDDAISGAEALAVSFAPDGAGGRLQIDYYHPLNFGKVLAFNPEDLDGKKAGQGRAGEFALYDEYNPMRKILLGTNGQYSATGQEYFLNFSSGEGAIGGVGNDGDDKLFGDLGNDWIVGGTGRDNLYGGFGNDLLNADDVLTTNGGANDQPDTHATYEDRAFGGAGRDVLIGNTGGDRLIDWTGEFNSFLVPFSPFGNNTVSRTLQPGLPEFLYRLSRSDGADPTRAGDVPGADPLRNGEPWGELGLVLQSDAAWGDQHGGPADPEPGNTQTKRDVLRSASFANNQAEGFLPVVGTWSVKNGRYEVAPAGGTNGDALSIFNDADTVIPNVFEMQATINALKPLAGVRANAYLIFDYWSPTDFKFAGIDVSTNKLQIGQRTATGWNVLASANVQVKSGTDYVVLLKVNYNAATVTLGNVSVSYGFPQRFDRLGFAHPISDGITGVGANGAAAQIDNVVVQAPPGAITLDKSADFSAAQPASGLFAAPLAGTWTMVNGRFESTSAGLNAPSIDLMHDPVSPGALLEITTTLRTSGQGGVVFDVHSPTYFKFAMLSADGRQVIIGHRNGDTWTTDAVGRVSIAAGTDYKMVVTVRGGLVNVSINGAVVASKLYNEPGTDGRYGFIARSGLTSFNDVRVRSDDVKHAAAPALLMATSEVAATSVTAAATPAWSELQALADEARRRWALAGADAGALARMAQVSVQFGRLDGAALARYAGLTVTIDTDAAGHGWFVDATPRADEEFRRAGTAVVSGRGDAAGRIDLLSVIAHELGHAAGLDHEAGGVMAESLAPGVRSLPMPMDTAPALPAAAVEIDWATPLRKGLPAAPIGAKAVPAASVDDWRVKFVAGLGRADPNAALRLHLPVTGSLTKAA